MRRLSEKDVPLKPHSRKLVTIIGALGLVASMVAFIGTGSAVATSVSVATEAEYRQALADLSSDPNGPHTVTLTSDITFAQSGDAIYTGTEELTIDGSGYTLDANYKGRALRSTSSPKVTLENITVTRGQGGQAGACCGGIFVGGGGDLDVIDSVLRDNRTAGNGDSAAASASGTLTLIRSTVTNNYALDDNGGVGANMVVVLDSTVSNNTAAGFRGEGAGIFGEQVVVINSTITGNRLTSGRGGQGGGGIMSRGPLTLIYATVVDNDGPAGKGENIRVWDQGLGAGMTAFASVVALPGGSANCLIDGGTSSTYSYDDDATCGFINATDTSGGANPVLGTLADNGGPTLTRLPDLATSPLVDAIPASSCSIDYITDQRAVSRPQGGACDIGAVEVEQNRDPIADAGEDQILEATSPSGAEVVLDGSGSFDPDDDPLTYSWTKNSIEIATGETTGVTLGLGSHSIVLEVTDPLGASDSDEVEIRVVDTTPPELTLSVAPDTLWPPNHKYVEVTVAIDVLDIADAAPDVRLVSVASNEPDEGLGDGDMPYDIVIIDETHVMLRAERSGLGEGRMYTLTYEAMDDSGNTTGAIATVLVPKDKKK